MAESAGLLAKYGARTKTSFVPGACTRNQPRNSATSFWTSAGGRGSHYRYVCPQFSSGLHTPWASSCNRRSTSDRRCNEPTGNTWPEKYLRVIKRQRKKLAHLCIVLAALSVVSLEDGQAIPVCLDLAIGTGCQQRAGLQDDVARCVSVTKELLCQGDCRTAPKTVKGKIECGRKAMCCVADNQIDPPRTADNQDIRCNSAGCNS